MEQNTPHAERTPDPGLLNIQVHLDLAPDFDIDGFRQALQDLIPCGLATRLSYQITEEDGAHLDAALETFDAAALWKKISGLWGAQPFGPALGAAAVAVRTGEHGWDDYVLLASYAEAPDADVPARALDGRPSGG